MSTNPMTSIPSEAVCFFRDGNKWCCVFGDFENLQESPAGFGDTFDEALNDLQSSQRNSIRYVKSSEIAPPARIKVRRAAP